MHRVFPRGPPAPPVPSVEPRKALELVEREGALIVDVREPDEWAEARIAGARHVPLRDLAARASELPRDRPVILQCRSGNRSARATRVLLDLGFTNVQNLEGGIGAWGADGLPVEPGED